MLNLNPIISIYGPTNSGKTSLAIELSKKIPSEIISVDSVQIYKEANIGSNKPEQNILNKYPHHLIDFIDPKNFYSVGKFKKDAINLISEIDQKDKHSILTGGTMMYFYSLFNGLADLPEKNAQIRKKIDGQERRHGLKFLHDQLNESDPQSAEKIHENDRQRIKRALEVFMISGKTINQLKNKESENILKKRKSLSFAIIPDDRNHFKESLKSRFKEMIAAGLIDETEMLIKKYSKKIPVLQAVGYKQVVDFLDNKLTKEEMIEKATNANYQLAKRQITWLNKLKTTEKFFVKQSNMIIKILSYLE
ncbi:MAG: tRNA (adenosine(37)-N6)-dimethylallyltransferase MiaA [Flavobacteriaceae bacterium]|nr:tRNA (adenosine(37)-N6)-dimethylallyltransferase MiaA [Flavobacteriaceae bacterium]